MSLRTPTAALALLFAFALLGACASTKQPPAENTAAAQIPVYNSTQFTPLQYQVIEHIWVDSWRSNISIPTFANSDEGIQALKEKAAGVGANGLLNVVCLDAQGYAAKGRLLCYGDAIKLKS